MINYQLQAIEIISHRIYMYPSDQVMNSNFSPLIWSMDILCSQRFLLALLMILSDVISNFVAITETQY